MLWPWNSSISVDFRPPVCPLSNHWLREQIVACRQEKLPPHSGQICQHHGLRVWLEGKLPWMLRALTQSVSLSISLNNFLSLFSISSLSKSPTPSVRSLYFTQSHSLSISRVQFIFGTSHLNPTLLAISVDVSRPPHSVWFDPSHLTPIGWSMFEALYKINCHVLSWYRLQKMWILFFSQGSLRF